MSDQYSMFNLWTSVDSLNATSSLESADGHTPCALPDGRTINPSGQEARLASHSARQGDKREKKMSDILPPILSDWLGPAAPQCCLENKSQARQYSALLQKELNLALQERLRGHGSMIYQTAWKQHVTPLGRQIFRLRASARSISGSEHSSVRSGWPTAQARDWKGPQGRSYKNEILDMPAAAVMAGWPTPTLESKEWSESAVAKWLAGDRGTHGLDIGAAAVMAGWPTPCAADNRDRGSWDDPAIQRRKEIGKSIELSMLVGVAGWPTPRSTDGSKGSRTLDGCEAEIARKGRLDDLPSMVNWSVSDGPARLTATGEMLTGSSAGMESGGQLSPAHSRWLMGYPPEWDDCAVMAMPSSRKRRQSSLNPS